VLPFLSIAIIACVAIGWYCHQLALLLLDLQFLLLLLVCVACVAVVGVAIAIVISITWGQLPPLVWQVC